MMAELDYFNGLFRALLSTMNIPKDLLERMLHEDVFMGADEAIRYGIAHGYETELI
jgi:ATP-dependent protease ClpP protease subunit